MGFARPYRNGERNSAASCDPRDEREHNPENDEHEHRAGGVEALVPQKEGEGAGIKDEAADKDAIMGKLLITIFRVWHLTSLDALQVHVDSNQFG